MRAMNKDFWREIRNTRARFASILILVALAVAFLSGLKATAPDMKATVDAYLDEQNFMDLQILSTLGLTDEDLAVLLDQEGVSGGEAVYAIDAFASAPEVELVTKVYSLPRGINRLTVTDGRLPEGLDECVVDEQLLELTQLSIGDKVAFRTQGGFADALREREFTIVGTVVSPYYISVERGTATLGAGRVAAYAYLPQAAFDMDYYTAIYLTLDGAVDETAFYQGYDDLVDGALDELEPLGDQRAALRREDLVDEVTEKLDEAQSELDEAAQEASEKLDDAQRDLGDARRELDNGWIELTDAKETLKSETADAMQKIADAKVELADALVKLADALVKLDDGEAKYADGVAEYGEGWRKYEDGRLAYEDGKKEYEDGLAEFKKNEKKLDEAGADLSRGEDALIAGRKQVEEAQAQFDAQVDPVRQVANGALAPIGLQFDTNAALLVAMEDPATAPAVIGVINAIPAALQQKINELDAQIHALEQQIKDLAPPDPGTDPDPTPTPNPDAAPLAATLLQGDPGTSADIEPLRQQLQEMQTMRQGLQAQLEALAGGADMLLAANRQLQAGWKQYNEGAGEFNAGYYQYQEGRRKLAEARAEIQNAKAELDDAAKELADAEAELGDARVQLVDARVELDDGWQDYQDGQRQLADAEVVLVDGVAEGEAKISDATSDLRQGELGYSTGIREYADAKAEASKKITDGEKKLADARRKVADIDIGEWYLLSRDSNPGYLGYGQDADRMGSLASVFPLLFFLVAALVCLTTMTRMVEDQRVQIGGLKALGYGRWAISKKYLGYGLLPALLGGTLGLCLGYTLFPKMIFTAYQIMYAVPDIQLRTYPDITLFSLAAAVACTTVSTLGACLATLTAPPASLMRPQAPRPGKRVLLEYIRPLWRRMSFNLKVTFRNLLRYQKRFWMTVVGIGGCTALIIAGFGLRSSLLTGLDRQYSEIYNYTAQLVLASNILDTERQSIDAFLASEQDITASLEGYLASATAESAHYSTTAYLQVTEGADLGNFITLRDFQSKEGLTLDDEGVIIDQKLSELLAVGVGDTLVLDLDGRYEVRVQAVTENYLGHYVYMTPAYYAQVFGEGCVSNAYLLRFTEDTAALCDRIFSELMEENGVASLTRISQTRDTYLQSMESIDFVVVIVILSAAALAMVVLYNLSNINITERKRELATIKVLGFYDGEVSAYVYRENIVLTALGIAAGILFGHYLHVWLVRSVEIDLMMFGRETDPWAYVWAGALTAAFSVAVNLLAHLKMKKIDMVESLKSAE